jgi:ribosomal protein L40E
MQLLLHRLMTRLRAWRASWRRPASYQIPLIVPVAPPIFREVSSQGVRVFSLCGSCGARMETSATLCSACASRRSPSSPF